MMNQFALMDKSSSRQTKTSDVIEVEDNCSPKVATAREYSEFTPTMGHELPSEPEKARYGW
jgi:hypothetical protein